MNPGVGVAVEGWAKWRCWVKVVVAWMRWGAVVCVAIECDVVVVWYGVVVGWYTGAAGSREVVGDAGAVRRRDIIDTHGTRAS